MGSDPDDARPGQDGDDPEATSGTAISGERCPGCGVAIARNQDTDEDDSLDDLLAEALAGGAWEPLLGPVVKPIRQLLDEGGSLEEVRDRLAEVLAAEGTEAMTEHLARVLFQGRLAGETGAETSDDQPGS